MNKKFNRNELLLLILYANNCSEIIGRTRIQKIVFLYEKECHQKLGLNKFLKSQETSLFGFYPHNYGPFSKKLYKYLEELVAYDMIFSSDVNIKKTDFSSEEIDNTTIYKITENGKSYVHNEILPFLTSIILDDLSSFKTLYTHMDINNLISFVYNKYEKYTTNSLIKDKYMRKELE